MNNEESERIEDTLKLLDGLIKIEKEGGAKATITRSILTDLKIKKSLIKKTAESCDKKWRDILDNVCSEFEELEVLIRQQKSYIEYWGNNKIPLEFNKELFDKWWEIYRKCGFDKPLSPESEEKEG